MDLCGTVTVEVSSVTTPGNATGNYVIPAPSPPPTMRTATAVADHHRARHHASSISLEDTLWSARRLPLMSATATDGCGPVAVTFTDLITPGNATGNYTVARTITATDDAGNATTAVQNIPCRHHAPNSPSCQPTTPSRHRGHADGRRHGDGQLCEVTVTVSSETTAGDTGNYTITRTFTATDDAGNSSSATQTISVQDTTAPALTVPADYTTECSEGLVLDLAEAIDADPQACPWTWRPFRNASGNHTVIRTFTATDDAGNSTSARKPSPWWTPHLPP